MCDVCALHCAQLLHTILHRPDLITFPLALLFETQCRYVAYALIIRQFNSGLLITLVHVLEIEVFAAAGPRHWSSLPTHVRRLYLSLDTFRRKLKTCLTVRGISA